MSAIVTQLDLRVRGVAEAVSGLNQVARASRGVADSAGQFRKGLLATGQFGMSKRMIGDVLDLGTLAGGVGLGGGIAGLGILAVSSYFSAMKEEVGKHNDFLRDQGYKAKGFWGQIFGTDLEIDPQAMGARLERQRNALEKSIAATIKAGGRETIAEQLQREETALFGSDLGISAKQRREFRNERLRELQQERDEQERTDKEREDRRQRWQQGEEAFQRRQSNAMATVWEQVAKDRKLGRTGTDAQLFLDLYAKRQTGQFGGDFASQWEFFQDQNNDKRAKLREMEGDLERGQRELDAVRRTYLNNTIADISKGPQYSDITLAGSHQARMDANAQTWDETWKDELQTANGYLATIASKIETTGIYQLN